MISKIVNKLTSLYPWQLLLIGIFASEILTLFFSVLFSFILWNEIPPEVIVIGMIDAFIVALIVVSFTIVIVKRIKITEINNKQLLKEIEERKRTEFENRKLEKQLRQAQKMEAVGTLAGGIAHDFNNILTAILGYSEMARLQLPPDHRIGKNLDQVILGVNRATDLVQQILTFSRQEEEKLQPLHVQYIIKEALKLLRASLPTTIQLKTQIMTNCHPILANPIQIHQVLMNLCSNAKDAIGEASGTLSVSLTEIEVTEDGAIKGCPQIISGAYLDLEIRDTGCGMDDLTLSKLFDPFFTTKEKGKGTGLGLAVVHGIIKQHNGEITVSSKPAQGTIFNIYLPVIDEEYEVVEQDKIEDIPQGNGERILFVDDEPVIANMMQESLESLGYFVTVFTRSVEALEAYQKNPGDFDLVITDMTMPEMTGVDLTKKLLALQPGLPIILCTGFSEAVNETKAKALGVREYIKKPVEQLVLAKTVKKALCSS